MRKLAQIKLHDRNGIALANQSGIQVAWFDQPEPKDFSSVVYKSGVLTTNPAGRLSVDIDAATSLGVSDNGFLLAYKLDSGNHQDSLVFAGKMAVELGLATEAYLLDVGDLGFVANLRDFSTLFQDSAGATPVTAIGQSVGRIDSANGSGVYASQATSSKKPILKRMPTSGVRNLLADSDDIYVGVDWSSTTDWSPVQVNSYNNHASAKSWLLTNPGGLTSRNFSRIVGESDGSTHTLSTILERGSAATSAIAIRDNTASAFATLVSLAWGSGNVTVSSGVGSAVKLADIGPNGGSVYRIICTGTVPAGNTISRFLYCTGSVGVNTDSVIFHAAQYEKNNVATNQQITVGGYDVYEDGFNQIYWLDYDGVDDELVLNNPDLGTNATRIRAQLGGPIIESGLTLGANLTLNTDNLGLILINRALTADELTAITNFYNEMVA